MKNETWRYAFNEWLAMAFITPLYIMSLIYGPGNMHRLGTKILKKAEEIEKRVKK
jgi:hypothetical protein